MNGAVRLYTIHSGWAIPFTLKQRIEISSVSFIDLYHQKHLYREYIYLTQGT
jgi:hypothetical protein